MSDTHCRFSAAQLEYCRRQDRWEILKAVAMILLAALAIASSARLADWLWAPRPQIITVHIEGLGDG